MRILTEREIQEGLFLRRTNRFLVHCRLGNAVIRAHLPNPGRLRELLLPGRRLLLQRERGRRPRKTAYTVVAVIREGIPVFLHTSLTNTVAARLIDGGLVPGLEEYRVARREVVVGRSRFDLLLQGKKRKLLLEVKSCTLFGEKIAMFPDAVTERGRRHLLELAHLAERGEETGVLFVVHWPKARFFLPDYHTDPGFSEVLARVREKVQVRAVAVSWKQDLTLFPGAREVSIPWRLLARENRDGGAYLMLLRRRRGKRIAVGRLGRIFFPRGFYIYVGSALRDLTRRVERHRRTGKAPHWHIDYLRNEAEWHGVFPVRTADDLECRIAAALRKITERSIPFFGSSDCACPSHLFAMDEDPLEDPEFVRLLLHFRMDRLLERQLTIGDAGGSSGRE